MQTKANLQDLFLLRARRDKLPVTMFLLPAVAVQHHHKGVKPRDGAPHLEAVHQKHGDG